MKERTLISIAVAATFVVAPFTTPSALAQGSRAIIDEVVVTARKREESLLEVPLTVTAFTSDDIERLGLKELTNLVDFTPGFFYSENSVGRGGRFNRRLIFRGMNPRTDRQTRQGATLFIDGAPVIGSELGSTDNYERIEIIKGPQSAYFGRSTFSGAINAVSRTPTGEWGGRVSAEVANFGSTDLGAQLEGALIADKLTFRVTGRDYRTDGEYRNSGNPNERLGAEATTDVSLTLFATPTDQLSAKLRLHAWRDSDGPSVGIGISRPVYPEFFNCTPGGVASGNGSWICGEIPVVGRDAVGMDTQLTPQLRDWFFNPAITARYMFDVPERFGLKRTAHEASLVLDYELGNGMTLSSITAVHKNDYSSFEDFDRRPSAGQTGAIRAPAVPVSSSDSYNMTLTANKDFFQELRLASAADQRLRWMLGFSYFEVDASILSVNTFGGLVPNPNVNINTFEPETTAVFGSVSYDLTDQLTLNVEGRYQRDKVVEGNLGQDPLSATFNSATPRVILDYKPTENTTFYLTYGKGTNPGQFNAQLLARSPAELAQIVAAGVSGIEVDEEKLTNYEAGVKGRFLDGRATASLAVYMADWSNIVAPEIIPITTDAGTPLLVQVNATGGQADLYGVEFEGAMAVTESIRVEATYAWTQSEVKTFNSPDNLALAGSRSLTGSNNQFSRTPEHSGTLSATYFGSLGADMGWYLRGDMIYRGSIWLTEANLTEAGAVTTTNLRLGLEKDAWSVEAFALNVFDEKGYSGLQRFPDFTGQSGNGIAGAGQILAGFIPRASYGIKATFNF